MLSLQLPVFSRLLRLPFLLKRIRLQHILGPQSRSTRSLRMPGDICSPKRVLIYSSRPLCKRVSTLFSVYTPVVGKDLHVLHGTEYTQALGSRVRRAIYSPPNGRFSDRILHPVSSAEMTTRRTVAPSNAAVSMQSRRVMHKLPPYHCVQEDRSPALIRPESERETRERRNRETKQRETREERLRALLALLCSAIPLSSF